MQPLPAREQARSAAPRSARGPAWTRITAPALTKAGRRPGRRPATAPQARRALASLLNAPTGFTVTVRDLRPYTGAGWIVALCGDMQTMPGLGKTPAAFSIDVDEQGNIVGLF